MDYSRSIWNIPGVQQEYSGSPTGGFMDYQDSIRTPGGVHQDLWGSVTYRADLIPMLMGPAVIHERLRWADTIQLTSHILHLINHFTFAVMIICMPITKIEKQTTN